MYIQYIHIYIHIYMLFFSVYHKNITIWPLYYLQSPFSIISATEDSALSSQSREMESTSACGERCERWYSRMINRYYVATVDEEKSLKKQLRWIIIFLQFARVSHIDTKCSKGIPSINIIDWVRFSFELYGQHLRQRGWFYRNVPSWHPIEPCSKNPKSLTFHWILRV